MIQENLWMDKIIALFAVVFVFVVVLFFMMLDRKEKEVGSSSILPFLGKYSLIFGVVFLVIGLIIWIPILNGSETVLGYRREQRAEELVVIWDTAYFNPQFFLRALLGLSVLIIGIVITIPSLFRGIRKLVRG